MFTHACTQTQTHTLLSWSPINSQSCGSNVNSRLCKACSCLYIRVLVEGTHMWYWWPQLLETHKVLWWLLTVFTSPDQISFLICEGSSFWKTAACFQQCFSSLTVMLLSCASFGITDRNQPSGSFWGLQNACKYGSGFFPFQDFNVYYWIVFGFTLQVVCTISTKTQNFFKVFSFVLRGLALEEIWKI